jgi:hypothetical protein
MTFNFKAMRVATTDVSWLDLTLTLSSSSSNVLFVSSRPNRPPIVHLFLVARALALFSLSSVGLHLTDNVLLSETV